MADAEKALSLFESYSYNEEIEISKGVTISFLDAGHLLGSSSIYVKINEGGKETTLLFSGDIGNTARPLIRDPQRPKNADYVIVESTYGDRLHGERPDYETQFTDIIQRTLDRGGNVVIPHEFLKNHAFIQFYKNIILILLLLVMVLLHVRVKE